MRGLDHAQYGRCIHPAPKPDDQRLRGKVCFGTVPALVDAEDQV